MESNAYHTYCVIGWPLGHSLSPLLHNTGFRELQLQASYIARPVRPEELPAFIEEVRKTHISGCSVTIPHKSAILPFLDVILPGARRIGAVNTLFWENEKLTGDNTDCTGFRTPLENYPLHEMRVLVLGAGGAARACIEGLIEAKAQKITVSSGRSQKNKPSSLRHQALAAEFGIEAVAWERRHEVEVDLIVNATPLGMQGAGQNESPYDFTLARHLPYLAYDIVYIPKFTRFLNEAKAHGLAVIPGLEMFFHQGNAQFKRWTGRDLPEASRKALEAALFKETE